MMGTYFNVNVLIPDERVKLLGVAPESIYNVDETGFSGKEQPRQKVIGVRGRQAIQVKVIHIYIQYVYGKYNQ